MSAFIYILASKKNGTLYIGVTSDIVKRIFEHKSQCVGSFTTKYSIDKLVYFEIYDDIGTAIQREKQLKNWKRAWKIVLIEKNNRQWNDLYETLI